MTELVQLERHHDDFAKRNVRVLVVSVEGLDDARKTQADFPHLTVLADQAHGLSQAADLIHPHVAPDGSDADVPTTILVDRSGTVRWLYRSRAVIARLSPEEVLQAVDRNLSVGQAF
jgi:alkyl hydroperoxide reductase subunit AhpC